jgi:hypothetical protein
MRIYALPADAFPRASRVATADEVSLGKKPGEAFDILPALDAMELQKRPAFFADDARKIASAFRFDAPLGGASVPVAAMAAAKTMHQELVIEPAFVASPPTFALVTRHVKLGFEKPTPDVDVELSDAGGGPTVATAGTTGADGGADAGVSAAVAGGPAPAAPTPASPRGDGGTRWVYAAAIGGLVAGGLIAHFRKKKPGS